MGVDEDTLAAGVNQLQSVEVKGGPRVLALSSARPPMQSREI